MPTRIRRASSCWRPSASSVWSGLRRAAAEPDARRQHAAYVLHLVHRLDAFLAPFMPNAQQILDQLQGEYPNLHAALAWLHESGDVARLLELSGALSFFWQLRGHIREGRAWLEWGLAQDVNVPRLARAVGQIALAVHLFGHGGVCPGAGAVRRQYHDVPRASVMLLALSMPANAPFRTPSTPVSLTGGCYVSRPGPLRADEGGQSAVGAWPRHPPHVPSRHGRDAWRPTGDGGAPLLGDS